jgi:hypothetical protein
VYVAVPHLDYLDLDEKLEHDYDSSRKGGNRFATILLYMTDLEEKDGGETVFSEAWPTYQAVEDRVEINTVRLAGAGIAPVRCCACMNSHYESLSPIAHQALKELRESDQSSILEKDSWQEKMVRIGISMA